MSSANSSRYKSAMLYKHVRCYTFIIPVSFGCNLSDAPRLILKTLYVRMIPAAKEPLVRTVSSSSEIANSYLRHALFVFNPYQSFENGVGSLIQKPISSLKPSKTYNLFHRIYFLGMSHSGLLVPRVATRTG